MHIGGETGSSAHAKIDPTRRPTTLRSARFLRTRGDRPHAEMTITLDGLVPPHARRSTRLLCGILGVPAGSSARAEIDPTIYLCETKSARFLRSRGDRPDPELLRQMAEQVPPRARRSTPSQRPRLDVPEGSSARAEIDPCRRRGSCRGCRFLRTRGDRPPYTQPFAYIKLVPPHARRSTPVEDHVPRLRPGSSARAEIDPRSST